MKIAATLRSGSTVRLRAVLAGMFFFAISALTALSPAYAKGKTGKLLLSHIGCAEPQVELHFVVNNLPAGVTPLDLTVTINKGNASPTIGVVPAPTQVSGGNVNHYSLYLYDGFYEVLDATLNLSDGTTLSLHNPGDYSGIYVCEEVDHCIGTATCDGWTFDFEHPIYSGADIGVFALVDNTWVLMDHSFAPASLAPATVSAPWDPSLPAGTTAIRFLVQYDGVLHARFVSLSCD